MPANTGENVILDLGMQVDSTGAKADIQDIVEYIRDTIKQDFNIDIKANNLEELRQGLNALNGSLKLIKDDATGATTAIEASFKTANGEAAKLQAQLEVVNGKYQLLSGTDISAKISAGMGQLEKLNETLIKQEALKAQAALSGDAQQINSAEKQIAYTKIRIAQQETLLNIMKKTDAASVSGRSADVSSQITANKQDFITFAENIDNAKASLKEFQKIQQQAFSASDMDKSSQVYQDIQTNLQAAQSSLQTYVDQFNAAITNTGGTGQAVFQTLADGSVELTSSYQGNNEALSKMSQLINDVGKALKSSFAQKQDISSDTQKIQTAITAYKSYRDAIEVVQKAKMNGRSATQQEKDAVIQAKQAYEQCEQAILSNGEAVRLNTTYNRDKNQVTRNSVNALKEYEAQLKSTNNSMSGSIAQMIQMKLSFEGLQEAITKIVDTAKDLDSAMTEIQLVTQQSNEEAAQLMVSYSGLAQQMGTTTAEVAASADEWLLIRSL